MIKTQTLRQFYSTSMCSFVSNFRNQGLIRSLEPSERKKSMTTTLKWLCPPHLLPPHQDDIVTDLQVEFVKTYYVVSRQKEPRLMKASLALVYHVSFSLHLAVVTEVWCAVWDPCDEQTPRQGHRRDCVCCIASSPI